jgi:hypothetical protein
MTREHGHPEISRLDVLQYVLGRVTDAERRAAIERTRQSHPELWDGLPEAALDEAEIDERLGPDAAAEWVPEVLDNYFAQRAQIRRDIKQIAQLLRASKDGLTLHASRPLLRNWPAERFGGTRVAIQSGRSWRYGDKTGPAYPDLPEPPYVVPFQHNIYIGQPGENVPYGVVRIIASLEGRPLASIVRIMDAEADGMVWTLVVATTDLFGRNVPEQEIDYHVQPARRELFAWFPREEIERLAVKLPVGQVKERERVEALLHDLREWEDGR